MNPNLMIGIVAAATVLSAGTAVGANQVIASQIAPEEAAPANQPSTTPQVAARTEPGARGRPASRASRRTNALSAEQYLDGIMKRNLFDVTVIDAWNVTKTSTPEGDKETPLEVRLLGTVVATPAEFSSCLIIIKDGPWAMGYSIGDKLEGRTIVEIQERRVKLQRDSDQMIEWLSIDDEEGKKVTASAPDRGKDEDEDSGIQQTGDNKYAVSRELFDKYINDMESITKLGRALLHRGPDGAFDGYRLAAIRRNTLADQLGIKNGDIIHSVNGEPLTSLQAAMGAYNTMQTESNFCFEITRRRKPVELCYDVR